MTELPAEPGALVQSLADAWGAGDLDRIVAHFTDDAVYHNIPMDRLEGIEAIREGISGFLAMADFFFDTHRQVVDGNLVMNERTDTFTLADGRTIDLPVMGVFEVVEGRIAAWRDYFDMSVLHDG